MIKVGISSCVIGNRVRYDGGHKNSSYCTNVLSQHFDFEPFCPEMGIGLPVPRPTIRLEASGTLSKDASAQSANIIAMSKDGQDVTEALAEFAVQNKSKIENLSGYILCAKSPSCGMERVKVYQGNSGYSEKNGVGIFAKALKEHFPLLPLEEDGRLNDLQLRENFVTRVFAYKRWQELQENGLKPKDLLNFHAMHKYLLMAHSQTAYKSLGRLLANLSDNFETKAEQYIAQFMLAIAKPSSRKNNSNALLHIAGYFKANLDSKQRIELTEVIQKYQHGQIPMLAPLTLIQHFMTVYPKPYLQDQVFLNPHPESLALRYSL